MQKITPFLWYNGNAEEAINFYSSIFEDSKILSLNRAPDGKLVSAGFQLAGQHFIALNGGPMFKFTEAISLFITCETQQEIDDKWNKLTADGGQESMCGWLKDKYGLSWQIVPPVLFKLMNDKDPEKANRVMNAMLTMKKLNIQALQEAYDNK